MAEEKNTKKKSTTTKKNNTTKKTTTTKKNTNATKKSTTTKKNTNTKTSTAKKTNTAKKSTKSANNTPKKNTSKKVEENKIEVKETPKKVEVKKEKKKFNIKNILNNIKQFFIKTFKNIKQFFVNIKNKIVNYFKSYDEKEIEEPKLISFKFIGKLIILLLVILIFILLPKLTKKAGISNINVVNTDSIPIFTYHKIVPKMYKQAKYFDEKDTISEKVFIEQMKYLYLNGYKTISVDEFYCWYKGKCKFDNKTVMITFDDGYQEDYFIALPILEKYNFKATSFIVGIRVKDDVINKYDGNKKKFLSNNLIKDIKNNHSNLTLESHSYDMHFKKNDKPISKKYNTEDILKDFKKNDKFKFKYIAYPYGYVDSEVVKATEKSKYNLGFLSDNGEKATRKSDKYKIPRIEIDDKDNLDTFIKWLN